MNKLEGQNDQQKFIDLYHKTMKLHKRLSAVTEEEQLTHNMTAVGHALRLMPPQNNDEWATMREASRSSEPDGALNTIRTQAEDIWK